MTRIAIELPHVLTLSYWSFGECNIDSAKKINFAITATDLQAPTTEVWSLERSGNAVDI